MTAPSNAKSFMNKPEQERTEPVEAGGAAKQKELLSCPRCGKQPIVVGYSTGTDGTSPFYRCPSYNCHEAMTADWWNKRAASEADSVGRGNENQSAVPVSENPEVVSLRSRLREAEEALRQALDELTCGADDDQDGAHFCPRCDNSLFDAKARVKAALEAAEQEKETK